MTRITIKDIAKATGLTVNTVSHALRDKDDISAATKERIRSKAAELGYVPNVGAAALRSGKTRIVGIVYDNLLNPYYSIMMHYLDESLSRNGYSFITFVEKSGEKIGQTMVDRLLQRDVDGIISFLEPDERAAERFRRMSGMPLLIIGRHLPYDHIDYIYTDDREGGSLAARHLIERGYRDIVYMTDSIDISCAAERIDGYERVMRQNGLTPQIETMIGGSYAKSVEGLLAEGRCDAIICFNDMMAFEVLSTLGELGRRDVAVIGYDEIQNELKIPGRITTIGYDKAQIADVAAEVLLYKIAEPGAAGRAFKKVHEVKLVDGGSTPQKGTLR